MPQVIDRLYTALQQGDAETLLELLHPEFTGHVAPGMPCGAGGVHQGAVAMLTAVWGEVHRHFDSAPYPETQTETADGTIVVTGHYRGTARSTGRAHDAEFAHLWRLRDGRIAALHQYTDTAKWHEALAEV